MTKRNILIIYTLFLVVCPIIASADLKQVAAGYQHTLIVKTDGSLWACGLIGGQFADKTSDRTTFLKVMDGVASVAAGDAYSLIVKTDGTLWACGNNSFGGLGDGTTIYRTNPVKVMDSVASVSAGKGYPSSLIVKTDGSLWVCGWNYYAQLGVGSEGTKVSVETPYKVMDGVASVAAGGFHSLIVKTDGSLWAFGSDGSNRTRHKVMDGVASVAAGYNSSLIVKTNGTLWTYGFNHYGELGTGDNKDLSSPRLLMSDVASVAAGNYHTLIVKTDGSLWACGLIGGQFADKTSDRTTPVKVMDGVASVAAGHYHSLIVKTDGSLWACGSNWKGQLGIRYKSDKSTPFQVQIPVADYSYDDIGYNLYHDLTSEVYKIATTKVDFEIPNTVQYNGNAYVVTAVGDCIFNDGIEKDNPYSVSFPSTITDVSEDAFKPYGPSAIIWKSNTALSWTAFSGTDYSGRNLLLYVNDKSIAPSNVKNVVVNGIADNITLNDGKPFYCPQAFTAKEISYTHNYQMETSVGASSGWETIALPFAVQTITHESKGELVPFANYNSTSGKKPFWLYQFSNKGFVRANSIAANTPYLISMPNNDKYSDTYCLNGKVTFSASNATVEPSATDNWHTATYNGSTFAPCFSEVSPAAGIYALNVSNDFFTYSGTEAPGSIFLSNHRKTMPFEGRLINGTATSRTLTIDFADDEALGIEELLTGEKSQNIYNMRGQVMGTVKGASTGDALKHLPKGLYIINGRKVVK